jgi:hypothetical protein
MNTTKVPVPGYGIAIIDETQDTGDDNMGKGAQIGKLITITEEDKSRKIKEGYDLTFGDLLDKVVYWRAYAEADGRWYDEELGKDIIFLDLTKLMGYENETINSL